MFITRGELTLSLDSIESFRCLNTGCKEHPFYWIEFTLKTKTLEKTTPYNGCTEYIKDTVRFGYRGDRDARDLAYRLLVEKYSLEL